MKRAKSVLLMLLACGMLFGTATSQPASVKAASAGTNSDIAFSKTCDVPGCGKKLAVIKSGECTYSNGCSGPVYLYYCFTHKERAKLCVVGHPN